MHLFTWADDSEAELRAELSPFAPSPPGLDCPDSMVAAEFPVVSRQRAPLVVFSRQWLPEARPIRAESIGAWTKELFQAVVGSLPEGRPWSLHIEPYYGVPGARRIGARAWHSLSRIQGPMSPSDKPMVRASAAGANPMSRTKAASGLEHQAGRNRCTLIRGSLVEALQRKRRHLLRQLRKDAQPFTPEDSLVQLILTSRDTGFLSVARSPMPFEQRHLLSPFPKGAVEVASDQAAPSRAFGKLVEAERRLGRRIQIGETCVDLGAAPGSWTYVAAGRGARVMAVDRSPLRRDLAVSRFVDFVPGDAFQFQPEQPVDWLLCDVIAEPERTTGLLLAWLRQAWCRHFIVTIKLRDTVSAEVLAVLKRELPGLTSEVFLTRLCANKKEICAFGIAR